MILSTLLLLIRLTVLVGKLPENGQKAQQKSMNIAVIKWYIELTLLATQWTSGHGSIGAHCGLQNASGF